MNLLPNTLPPIQVFPHLLIKEPLVIFAVPGKTIAEILQSNGFGYALAVGTHTVLTLESEFESRLVTSSEAAHLIPRPGQLVNVRIIPSGGGGGKNPLASILTIATLAIGAWAAPLIAGSITGLGSLASAGMLVGAESFIFSAVTAVAFGGIAFLGSMAVNAIAPPQTSSVSGSTADLSTPTVYSITGVSNKANVYGPIPFMVGGTDRIFPVFLAETITEVAGEDQFLRCRFGMVRLESVSDLKLGDTLLSAYDDVEIEICLDSSVVADRPTLYSDNQDIHQDPENIALRKEYGTITRVTQPQTSEVSFDYAVSSLFSLNKTTGDRNATSVQFSVRIINNVTAVVAVTDTITISGKYTALTRFNKRYVVPVGTYRVEWLRITSDDDGAGYLYNETSIIALRSISKNEGLVYDKLPPMTIIDLRIRATGQLNGTVDSFNFIGRALLPVWNRTTLQFVYQYSANPAWAYVGLLMGPQRKPIRRVTDPNRFDLNTLIEWADICEAQGWKINGTCDSDATLLSQMHMVAAVGRGSAALNGHIYSVCYDWYKDRLRQVITPRNSWGFESKKVFTKITHAVDVTFKSKADAYQDTTVRVYNDGYDASSAEQVEELAMVYVDNAVQATKQSRFHMADAQLRPETHTFYMDVESLVARRGERVRLVHDVLMVGLGQAYIRSIIKDGNGNITSAIIDSAWQFDAGALYGVAVRSFAGLLVEGYLANTATETEWLSEITFNPPLPASAGIEGGELIVYGKADKGVGIDCIITKIEPDADLIAKITVREYAPAVFEADQGAIPPYDPAITKAAEPTLAKPPAPTIEKIVSDESVILLGSDGSLTVRAFVTIAVPVSTIPISQLRLDYKLHDNDIWAGSVSNPIDNKTFVLTNLEDGELYDLRVCSISKYGVMSTWLRQDYVYIEGKVNPPPNVGDIVVDGKLIRWEYPDKPADFAGYRVRYNTQADWNSGIAAHEGLLLDSSFRIDNVVGSRLYMVKAVDKIGLESLGYSFITAELLEFGNTELSATENQAPLFGGVKDSCTLVDGKLISDSTDKFWTGDSNSFWRGAGELFWEGGKYKPCRYGFKPAFVSAGGLHALDVDANSAPIVEYRKYEGSIDLDATTGWFPWSGSLSVSGDIYFRLRWNETSYQVVVDDIKWLFSAPTVEETLYNIRIESGTGTILPIAETYDLIKSVNILALYYGTNGAVPVINNKNATGPLVSIVDAAGNKVSGYIDVTIKGFKG